jgi:hypothetical protein
MVRRPSTAQQTPNISTGRVFRTRGIHLKLSILFMSYYVYLGPLGEVVRHGASFIASKDGFLIGEYDTFGEAMESLAWKGRTKTPEPAKAVGVPADMEFPL